MNKRIILICGFSALIASCGNAAEDQPTEATPTTATEFTADTTIVTVNGRNIPLDLFHRFYLDHLRRTDAKDTPTFKTQVLNKFVNILITAQDAEKRGLDKDQDFLSALEVQRLRLLSRFAIQHALTTHEPSDEDLQRTYDEHYGKEKRIEYKTRHILVKTEDEGKRLIEKLKDGADFAELAKTHSLGPTGKQGGELSWFGPRQMLQPFTDATAALKPGEYSGTPVRTQFGWHVILLEDTRETQPPALEDVKNELTRILGQDALKNYLSELHDKADVNLNPDLVKTAEEDPSEPAASE